MRRELEFFHENNVWTLVEPKGVNAVKCKWVFKVKRGIDGEIIRYRARLVAKGFIQKYGINFSETFAPVVRHSSIRLLFALAAQKNLTIDHLDVQTAFLYGDLEEQIYLSQPEGFIKESNENKVYLLKKAIYGLKQSSYTWNKKAKSVLIKLGHKQCKHEPCVFIKIRNKSIIIVALYVDDFFIFYNDLFAVNNLKETLHTNFKIKDLGELAYALGMKIEREMGWIKIKSKTVFIFNID